ncbi:AbrB family transcriptional regulator [Aneurinibacillus migulanus]|uniref:AbrB family transcriptional regulator n=1 Tax=Aneurinibacillus migulanus TaxID=47500 RepID=A0A0D1XWK3_ANEMI|nr:AbrB/MazE/SpoVT family DNA-binding domain-containing protein [Aneurinibacillus migulanus]KIV55087.1 AbrB family transcriptional regulator [Aneurinibacillus migulanus]KIV56508.1 AbrB family transcriptional regulator [Aneurinibacillus migulanus]KON95265.1 AbrB family transcriptional regulator [Aneurinibacillus migulanus]KPD06141.1 AbrB family transcriptional regulator [Aneurinibacillus migulanus]MCP1355491.1 AbrB/MazE/SpoVT family DNA-binding domain-containing protein [Aneurinibacillus migula
MSEPGVVRRLNGLGKIVIPIEIRRELRIQKGDSMKIFIEDEKIVLQKYNSGCSFCESVLEATEYKGKSICVSCFEELKHT